MKKSLFTVSLLSLVFSVPVGAQDYPDMVGVWRGLVRVVSSGNIENDRLDLGGVIINEIVLEVRIDAQEGETFVGRSRVANAAASDPGTHVWGSIRSSGDEALFITANGSRGHLWFDGENSFEYCLTNLSVEESSITSYCATLEKQ